MATVVFLHGYTASPVAHDKELASLSAHGFDVLTPEAPGHGTRADGRIEAWAGMTWPQRRERVLDLARVWGNEVRELIETQPGPTGLVGISMGAFAALAQREVATATAALLAGPEIAATGCDRPLLLGLAERDESIPFEPSRAYGQREGAQLCTYPDSGHIMRAEDWEDLWMRTVAFLCRELE